MMTRKGWEGEKKGIPSAGGDNKLELCVPLAAPQQGNKAHQFNRKQGLYNDAHHSSHPHHGETPSNAPQT